MDWTTDHTLSLLSVIIAFIALGVSIKSCRQSEQSVRIAAKEFQSDRSVVWSLDVSEEGAKQMSAISSGTQLQKAYIYFPPNFGVAALPVRSPDYQLSSLAGRAIEIGVGQIDRHRKKRKMLGPVAAVPVVVESWYATEGISYRDVSVYSLEFEPRSSTDSLDIEVTGLSLAR